MFKYLAPAFGRLVCASRVAPRVMATASSMGILRDARAALDLELASVRRGVKRAQKQASRTRASSERAWKLTPRLANTVLAIHASADGVAEPAVRYLVRAASMRHWPAKSDDEVAALVSRCVADATADYVATLCSAERSNDVGALRNAVNHVEEWRLRMWTASLNAEQGVARELGIVATAVGRAQGDASRKHSPTAAWHLRRC